MSGVELSGDAFLLRKVPWGDLLTAPHTPKRIPTAKNLTCNLSNRGGRDPSSWLRIVLVYKLLQSSCWEYVEIQIYKYLCKIIHDEMDTHFRNPSEFLSPPKIMTHFSWTRFKQLFPSGVSAKVTLLHPPEEKITKKLTPKISSRPLHEVSPEDMKPKKLTTTKMSPQTSSLLEVKTAPKIARYVLPNLWRMMGTGCAMPFF